jgi:exosortase
VWAIILAKRKKSEEAVINRVNSSIQMTNIRNKISLFYLFAIIVFTILIYYPFLKGLINSWIDNFTGTFGYLAPFVSIWAIWLKRKEIFSTNISSSRYGWFYFSSGILLAILSLLNGQALLACVSLTLYLFGISLIFLGKKRSRHLLFPIFFLLFLYPWGDLLDIIVGFQLRRFSVFVAYFLFTVMGMEAAISGTLLYTGRFLVDIAPSCSGITIMNVLLFMGAVGAYLYDGKKSKGILLFLSVIPLSVLLNTVRILITGLTGHFFGEEIAMGFYHDASGMVVFGFALLFLYFEGCIFKQMDRAI